MASNLNRGTDGHPWMKFQEVGLKITTPLAILMPVNLLHDVRPEYMFVKHTPNNELVYKTSPKLCLRLSSFQIGGPTLSKFLIHRRIVRDKPVKKIKLLHASQNIPESV